jgi:hypothetical protein
MIAALRAAKTKTERSGGAGRKRGVGKMTEGVTSRPYVVKIPAPPLLSPPNFVFCFAKNAANKKGVALVPPAHTRAKIRNSHLLIY